MGYRIHESRGRTFYASSQGEAKARAAQSITEWNAAGVAGIVVCVYYGSYLIQRLTSGSQQVTA